VNSLNIIGRIGKEIELKYLASGSAVANFSIAVNQDYKDKNTNEKVEKTSWFDVTAFGNTAENVNTFFNKGSMIGISGELEQQQWKTDSGENRSRVIIKLQNFTFIDKKQDNQQDSQQQQNYNAPQQQQNQGGNNYNQPQQQQQNYNNNQQQQQYNQPNQQQQQQNSGGYNNHQNA